MASTPDQQDYLAGDDVPLQQLLSADQGEILDIIDTLRGYGISGELSLPLPQIVVCGDQSSGKSSVLEAISGRPFPKGDNVCTTFPTELALRRSPVSSVSVSIKPAASRDPQETSRLKNFNPKSSGADGFEATVKAAKDFLRKESNVGADSYFKDVLHVEVSQPSLPPLTLVDLPGIIHAPNARQLEEDVDNVRELVKSYLNNENSIILAIITSQNDPENQAVLRMVKQVDPAGQRTLGIITKPDLLVQTPRKEDAFIKCARNEEHRFELGWHVVKNQPSEGQPSQLEDRDRQEAEFFSRGVWKNALRPDQLGIAALRTRLSTLLEERTRPALPKVVQMIKDSLATCEEELDTLGQPRVNAKDQAVYLTRASQRFQRICEQSVDSTYREQAFFGAGEAESLVDPRRLRSAVGNLNDGFATTMRTRGHQMEIVDSTSDEEWDNLAHQPLPTMVTAHYTIGPPTQVNRDQRIREIEDRAQRDKGCELPGLPNHRVIPRLFREQSVRWEKIATEHIEFVRDVVQENLGLIASYVSASETSAALKRHLISAEMDRRLNEALKQLRNLLKPFQRDFFITLDEDFIRTVQDLKVINGNHSEVDSASSSGNDTETASTPSFMLDYMLAYYKVALRSFIDNVANLAVEQYLIDGLPDVFTATKVAEMDDELLNRLAFESDVSKRNRVNLLERKRKLQEALKICKVNSRLGHALRKGTGARNSQTTSGSSQTNGVPAVTVTGDSERQSTEKTGSTTPELVGPPNWQYSFGSRTTSARMSKVKVKLPTQDSTSQSSERLGSTSIAPIPQRSNPTTPRAASPSYFTSSLSPGVTTTSSASSTSTITASRRKEKEGAVAEKSPSAAQSSAASKKPQSSVLSTSTPAASSSKGLFSFQETPSSASASRGGSPFAGIGAFQPSTSASSGLFGALTTSKSSAGGGLFSGFTTTTSGSSGSLFVSTTGTSGGFGGAWSSSFGSTSGASGGGLLGNSTATSSSGLGGATSASFGSTSAASRGGLFGSSTTTTSGGSGGFGSSGLFGSSGFGSLSQRPTSPSGQPSKGG